mgnify:FL=1
MTNLQRQAVLVCVVCALAALLTIGITMTLLKRGKGENPAASADSAQTTDPADGADGDLANHYQIDNTSSALLTETADAGTEYLDSTLFLGDSNTVRLYNNGLISLQQFCAKEGIGTQAALNDGIVTFKNDSNHYTIAQAVAKMKPRRVVMTFGTNDTGMEVSDFISNYTALVQAIQEAYPYTDIIVNTVPPIPENHSNYPHMDQAKIDDFNMALLNMCEQLGLKFLNTAETLKGENGYGKAEYYTDGDIHLKSAGLKAALNYLCTHAYQTEDRRPDTNNIPTRTMEYVSNPSSAVQASSSEAVSSSESESVSSSESTSVKFEARYQVEKSGGGTLTCGGDSGKTSLTYSITDASQSLTVTANPAEGHVFVKWSDGVTSKTRTDTSFKQNLDVTAVFAAVSVHISEGKGSAGSYVFKASLNGKYAKSENLHWFANGQEVKEAAGQTTVTVPASAITNGSYKIYAVVVYNDCAVASNALSITVSGSVESASSSSSSSSSSSGTSSGGTSSSSSESSSSGTSSSSSGSASSSSHSTSESESKSDSKSENASSSNSSSEGKAESASSSHSESTSSSHSSSASESKAESKEETTSKSSSASTENDIEQAESTASSVEAEASR